jgi:sigma-E factor negative regulatory protein RseA
MDKMDNHELISALADGEVPAGEVAAAVQAACGDAAARREWLAYQVIGEVMRSGRADHGTAPEVFLARLQGRLQQEQQRAAAPVAAAVRAAGRPAANDWLWKMVAGVASVAAVSAVGWNLWGAAGAGGQPQLAAAPAAIVPVSTEARTATMIRDPRLDQLLAAHRQLGGATALQTPSGFLRNATFEGPAR